MAAIESTGAGLGGMKLYICWGLFRTAGSGHPCRNAHDALVAAGHRPTVVRCYGWGVLPPVLNRTKGRRTVRRLTGNAWVPLLVIEDAGVLVQGTDQIVAWAARSASRSGRERGEGASE